MLRSLGLKVLAVVGLAAGLGMTLSLWAYSHAQERAMREQNERSMVQTSESVTKTLQSVMLAGDAVVAQSIENRLRAVTGAQDFRILRVDGTEAFRDNKTIRAVNDFTDASEFAERPDEGAVQVVPRDAPALAQVAATGKPVALYAAGPDGQPLMTILAPIPDTSGCSTCHGRNSKIRGVIKFTVTLAPLEQVIAVTRRRGALLILASVLLTLVFTALILNQAVVKPIALVTAAMGKAAGGDLDSRAIAEGKDEIARMATSFNAMTSALKDFLGGLQRDHETLMTIIRSAKEAIIIADSKNKISLANPTACLLLGKSAKALMSGDILDVFDDRPLMKVLLADENSRAELVYRGDLILSAQAARVRDEEGRYAGSAVLIRDVTLEQTLQDRLRRLSTADALTGLFNRRFLDDTLRKELARAQRYKHPLSVLLIDIDHLGTLNDQYGQDFGDKVLKVAADKTRMSLREHDFACRHSGGEFLVILPATSGDGALDAAERLHRAIGGASIDGLSVTASVGCASYPEVFVNSPSELIERAEAALQVAKTQGRNRCVRAEATA